MRHRATVLASARKEVSKFDVQELMVDNRVIFSYTDIHARMPFVMHLKMEEFKKCRAEHRCPIVVPAQQNVPCQ